MSTLPRLPDPLTPQSLRGLMTKRAYRDQSHPQFPTYQRIVKRGFQILYPGTARYDVTGRMIDDPPLPPEQVRHLVEQTNRELDAADPLPENQKGASVHVQAHTRDGGKTEVSDHWRASPREGREMNMRAGIRPRDPGQGAGDGADGDELAEHARGRDPYPESPLDFDFRDALAKAEHSHGKPDDGWSEHNKKTGALGRYQLTDGSLSDAEFKDEAGQWTKKARDLGVESTENFLKNPHAQEKALADSTAAKDGFLKNNGAKARLGHAIQGIEGDFKVTEAGLAAAAHREGAFAVKQYLDHQKSNDWKSDFDALPEKKREIFKRIETRLRIFEKAPYRRSDSQ